MTGNKERKIPFQAALFDLDGTLLNSMYVWAEVDRRYFAEKGIPMPEDYPRALSGLSYRQSAEYTRARFGFPESWEEIVATWTRMSREEYHCRVGLKPGSREYLQYLKKQGVKLAVATALPPDLYEECLKRNGVYDLFDAFCSTKERSKEDGGIFLRAAAKLGVKPEQCAVFEDVYEGIAGAKRVGMQAYCILDAAASYAHGRIAEIADGMLESIWDMRRVHDLPGRCVIFAAVCEGKPGEACRMEAGDLALCADGGQNVAHAMGIVPDVVLGDFDSSREPANVPVIRHPKEKDDTDTMLCVRYALERGFRDILIVGGLGGRFGHSIANVQTLLFAGKHGARAVLDDGNTRMQLLTEGEITLIRRHEILSVFAVSPECTGVTLRGLQYPLENAVITNDFPVGCSNHFVADTAYVSVEHGTLLLVEEDERCRSAE